MSGLGRRTHYRKHLTDSVWNGRPEPAENERIAKVIGTRGSNQFELVIDPQDGELDMTHQLAILPTKFRKLVWLKRNDYVICAVAEDENGELSVNDNAGIRFMIAHILYKDQVKHLKDQNLWPKDDFFSDDAGNGDSLAQNVNVDDEDDVDEYGSDGGESDGIVYNNDDDAEYFCNTNRIAKLKVADSSDESDEGGD